MPVKNQKSKLPDELVEVGEVGGVEPIVKPIQRGPTVGMKSPAPVVVHDKPLPAQAGRRIKDAGAKITAQVEHVKDLDALDADD